MTGERLIALQVRDAPSAGYADLAGEWEVRAEREDSRGVFFRANYYRGATAAIAAAQQMRSTENPAADLAVYCPKCHRRCAFLGGHICPDCMRAVAS